MSTIAIVSEILVELNQAKFPIFRSEHLLKHFFKYQFQ